MGSPASSFPVQPYFGPCPKTLACNCYTESVPELFLPIESMCMCFIRNKNKIKTINYCSCTTGTVSASGSGGDSLIKIVPERCEQVDQQGQKMTL